MGTTWCPVEQSYLDVRDWLDARVAQFYRHYGEDWTTRLIGDREESRSYADEVFLDCYHNYEGGRSTFVTYVGYKLWKQLQQKLRRALYRNRKLNRVWGVELDTLTASDGEGFDYKEFTRPLSKDARRVVKAVVADTPLEIYLHMAQRHLESATVFRRALRSYFRDLGWSAARVTSSFREIQQALQGN